MIFAKLFQFFLIFAMLLLPGLALLILSNSWHHWGISERLSVSIGLGIAIYPVSFYGLNYWFPQVSVDSTMLIGLLLGCAVIAIFSVARRVIERRRHATSQSPQNREQPLVGTAAWTDTPYLALATIMVLLLTIGSRLWIVFQNPYPAWTDSLHHTIITQLVAEKGTLVGSLEPYFPIPLDMYHLGLYSLSGSAQMLTGLPAHTSLLWTAQILNGLCGIGLFFALERLLSSHIEVGKYNAKLGALCGAAVVGLFSHHPALYVSWGRFTQLSSQVILLIAWALVLETLTRWSHWWHHRKNPTLAQANPPMGGIQRTLLWQSFFCALLTAAVFLLHFRVAAFYILLLGTSISLKMWQEWRAKRLPGLFLGLLIIGTVSLIFVFPALAPALQTFVEASTEPALALPVEDVNASVEAAHAFPLSTIPYLVASPWLLMCTALATVIGLWRRNYITQISLVWTILLILLGNAYLLDIPVLNITNLGAVFIMLYLPIGLTIGAGLSEFMTIVPSSRQKTVGRLVMVVLIVIGGYSSIIRATKLENYRFFVTEQDIAAMEWIRENTTLDARFAVNTYFWFPIVAHGADAGYWIPYFTERDTTSPAMPILAADWNYQLEMLNASRTIEDLVNSTSMDTTTTALVMLQEHGVDYIYIGAKGHFKGSGLNAEQLVQHEAITLQYENRGAAILKIEQIGTRTKSP